MEDTTSHNSEAPLTSLQPTDGAATSDASQESLVLLSDPNRGATLRASSVLQKNTKLYSPMNALDSDNTASSWNSEGNMGKKRPTVLLLNFGGTVRAVPTLLHIQFQAGFGAESCTIVANDCHPINETTTTTTTVDLMDTHELQSVPLVSIMTQPTTQLKLVFNDPNDFYGRLIVYVLQVWGREVKE